LSIDLEVYTSATYEVISNKKKWVAARAYSLGISKHLYIRIDEQPTL